MAVVARGSRSRPLKIAGALVALAIAGVVATNAWATLSAHGRHYTSLASIPSRTVAIVPGARVDGGRPLEIFRHRLEAAHALYQEGRVRAILVSGNDSATAQEVTVARRWLLERGAPAGDIWTDELGLRTRDTMVRAAAVYRVTDAIVCTQSLYMPRTLLLARAAGIETVGAELPSRLAHVPRFVGEEALKTTLAVAESILRPPPPPPPPAPTTGPP